MRPGWAASIVMAIGVATIGNADRQSQPPKPSETSALATEYVTAVTQTFPLAALLNGMPDAPNDRLGDNSLAATRAWEQREDQWIARLRRIDKRSLKGTDVATYGVLQELLDASIQGRVCRNELWPLNQQSGTQIVLPLLSQLQPVGDATLRDAALARWREMPKYLDTEIATLREGLKQGYTLPRTNVQAIVEQLDDLLKFAPADSPFAAIAARDKAPGFKDAITTVVRDQITPALKRYREFLAVDYLPRAREETAISALPQGEACYRARVRGYSTIDIEPKAVHELGLTQMSLIEEQMRAIAQRTFGTTDVPAVLERLRTDPQYKFKTRQEMIDVAEKAAARAKAAMPRFLTRVPKADFRVDPCQPFEEKSGCPNSYVPGTPDGKRPGLYRINAGDPTSQPRPAAEGTAFHEGIPGHHLQIALAQERPDAHPLTRYFSFSGFSEGWALYAERVADEVGLYSTDVDRFGDLGEQALRAARLVVDPGLHVLGWNRQRAIDYMAAHLIYPRSYIESEVDRYIADPGQATAYMLGRLEIERLRAQAKTRLGDRFDLRVFHDHVLENGSLPLPMLRTQIEAWLETQR
jgi:uncharacterized protein (DUF885 family)